MVEHIKEYLNQLRELYRQTEWIDYFLKNAKEYKTGQFNLTAKEKKILSSCDFNKVQISQCFYNSQIITVDTQGKIKYVEGFYNLNIIIEHGWNTINNKLIDKTVELFNKRFKCDRIIKYLGLEIPYKFILENMQNTGRAECLLTKYIKSKIK